MGNILYLIEKSSFKISARKICKNKIIPRYKWNGTIKAHNVYSTYIIDCDRNHQEITVSLQYSNPDSKGDYREFGVFPLLIFIAFLYFIIFILWLINSHFYPQFHVWIHRVMTFLPLFKCISLLLESQIYIQNSFFDVSIPLVFSVVFYSLLFTTIGLSFSGLSTYSEHLRIIDILIYSICPFIFFGSNALSNYYPSFLNFSFLALLIIVLKVRNTYLNIKKLWKKSHENSQRYRLFKITSFMNMTLLAVFVLFIMNVIALAFRFWCFWRVLTMETGIIMLFITQMRYFFYKTSKQTPKRKKIVWLIEPYKEPKLTLLE